MLGSNSDVSSAMYREARIDGLDLKAPLNDTWLFKKIIGRIFEDLGFPTLKATEPASVSVLPITQTAIQDVSVEAGK